MEALIINSLSQSKVRDYENSHEQLPGLWSVVIAPHEKTSCLMMEEMSEAAEGTGASRHIGSVNPWICVQNALYSKVPTPSRYTSSGSR